MSADDLSKPASVHRDHAIGFVIMTMLGPFPARRTRLTAIVLAALVQVAVLFALLDGLAVVPGQGRELAALVSVSFPKPAPVAHPDDDAKERERRPRLPRALAAEGAAALRAIPRAVVAPPSRMVLSAPPAPPVAAQGQADFAGAAFAGIGSGAGGTASGPGGGGQNGGASGPFKLSGEINSARDYPAATRDLRLGDYVILALAVDAAGAVDGCRIVRPSRDADADAITCRLARERFRFRPAYDGAGRPVRSTFGWKQRWFRPGGG